MSNCIVRKATLDDAANLAALAARWFTDAFSGQVPDGELTSYVNDSFSESQLQSETISPGSCILLAEDNAQPIGYARLLAGFDPSDMPNAIRIVRLYVQSSLIGTGVGAALMQACIEYARAEGYRHIWLRVWEENKTAIEFYRKWGFVRHSTVEFEMMGGQKIDWVMVRRLT